MREIAEPVSIDPWYVWLVSQEDAMTDPDSKTSIRFYFSFRSPYAWLAAENRSMVRLARFSRGRHD